MRAQVPTHMEAQVLSHSQGQFQVQAQYQTQGHAHYHTQAQAQYEAHANAQVQVNAQSQTSAHEQAKAHAQAHAEALHLHQQMQQMHMQHLQQLSMQQIQSHARQAATVATMAPSSIGFQRVQVGARPVEPVESRVSHAPHPQATLPPWIGLRPPMGDSKGTSPTQEVDPLGTTWKGLPKGQSFASLGPDAMPPVARTRQEPTSVALRWLSGKLDKWSAGEEALAMSQSSGSEGLAHLEAPRRITESTIDACDMSGSSAGSLNQSLLNAIEVNDMSLSDGLRDQLKEAISAKDGHMRTGATSSQ
jgi:hypothetical protein